MLTRIEIDGFKTFRDFSMDVPPFLVIVGRNASGKSNLFDAIQFLATIASGSLVEAVHAMRGGIDELVHVPVEGDQGTSMRFAVEVLLDPTTRDDFGEERDVTHSRLRYEVELENRQVESSRRLSNLSSRRRRLFVKREKAQLIRLNDDEWVKSLGWNARDRQNLAPYSNKSKEVLLDTITNDKGQPAFKVHQDGRSGTTKSLPAADASATVLSTLTTMEYLHLWALKSEMQSWRQLHLEPEAVRSPSSFDDDDHLTTNGKNLPNVLNRILEETVSSERPQGILPSITASLSRIIPEVTDVQIEEDVALRQRQVLVRTGQAAAFPASVASDGTVRTLALLAALYDPDEGSLICFEEPENGIYPRRLVDLITQLHALVWQSVDRRRRNRQAVVNQLIVSSHSPVMLRALKFADFRKSLGDEVVFFDLATRSGRGRQSRVSRHRKVVLRDQGELRLDPRERVSDAEIASFEVSAQLV